VRESGSTLKQILAGLLIVVVASLAIRAVAARKNEELAGPAAYRLVQGPEREALETLLAELDELEQARLATRLRELDASGRLWVAPFMPAGRQAVYVNSLGLVERIYVARGALMLRELPFPDSGLPEDGRRLYALIRLGGTLYHELQHLDGVLDESEAYGREAAWYAAIARAGPVRRLGGAEKRRYDWAIESAILSVEKAAAAAAAAEAAGG
jgi:hypothetical protein